MDASRSRVWHRRGAHIGRVVAPAVALAVTTVSLAAGLLLSPVMVLAAQAAPLGGEVNPGAHTGRNIVIIAAAVAVLLALGLFLWLAGRRRKDNEEVPPQAVMAEGAVGPDGPDAPDLVAQAAATGVEVPAEVEVTPDEPGPVEES